VLVPTRGGRREKTRMVGNSMASVKKSSNPPSPATAASTALDAAAAGEEVLQSKAERDRGGCRSGFTTLPPVPPLEQYRCGSFVGGAQIAQGVGYQGIRWTRGFTWFRPPERNTLRPRVNGVVLQCLSARLSSSMFSLSARVWSSSSVRPCDCRLPGPFIA
jgi:hypothetical protein